MRDISYIAISGGEQHRFIVHIQDEVEKGKALQELIQKTFENNPSLSSITIVKEDNGNLKSIVEVIQNDDGVIDLGIPGENEAGNAVQNGRKKWKIIELFQEDKKIAVKIKTFSSVYDKTWEKSKTGYWILDLLIFLIILPKVLWTYATSPSVSAQKQKQLQKYLHAQRPSNFKELRHQLKIHLDQLKRRGFNDESEAVQQLQKLIALSKEIEENRGDLNTWCQTKLETLEEGETLYLPGGYFEGEQFVPCFYKVVKNEQGCELTLYLLSLEAPEAHKFNFQENENIPLAQLLSFSFKDAGAVSKEQQKQNIVFLQAATVQGGGAQLAPQQPGYELTNKEQLLKVILKEPVDDKAIVAFRDLFIANEELQHDEEVVQILQTLQDQQELGQADDEENVQAIGKLRALLREKCSRYYGIAEEISIEQEASDHREKVLPVPQSTIQTEKKEVKGDSATASALPDCEFCLQLLRAKENLENTYARQNSVSIQFGLLLEDADRFIESGEYEKAYEITLVLLNTLPCPSPNVPSDSRYWKGPRTFEELTEFSAQISRASSLHWEASLRLNRGYMKPEQFQAMLLSRAALVKIARLKSKLVKEKLQQTQEGQSLIVQISLGSGIWWNHLTEETINSLNLTYEEAATLLFDDYQTDVAQFNDIIRHHPHLRFGVDAKMERHMAGAISYLNSVGELEGKTRQNVAILRLDAEIDAPSEKKKQDRDMPWQEGTGQLWRDCYSHTADRYYLTGVNKLASLYNRVAPGDLLWNEVDPDRSKLLPIDMVHLRRHVIFFQNLLQPGFSMALHFGSGDVAAGKALHWLQSIEKKALQESGGDANLRKQLTAKFAYEQLQEQLQKKMRTRLKLSVDDYVLSGVQAVTICDKKNNKIDYVPWGLGLPDEVGSTLQTMPNEMNCQPLAGDVPREWLTEGIGIGGELRATTEPSDIEAGMNRKKTALLFSKRFFPNEATQMKQLLHGEDPIKEYLMRTLKVSNHDKRIEAGCSGILESLLLVASRPELLSDPRVRARMDLLFSEPFQMQYFIRLYPELIPDISKMLREKIDQAIEAGSPVEAAFLLHLNEIMLQQIEMYTKYYFLENEDPYKDFKEVKGIAQSDEERESLRKDFATTAKEMAGYRREYKKGLTYIGALETLKDTHPDAVLLAEAEALQLWQRKTTAGYFVQRELTAQQLANLMRLKQSFEGSMEHVGTPMFNAQIFRWITTDIVPSILALLESDPEKFYATLNELSGSKEKGKWERIEGNKFVKGEVTLDFDTLSVREGGIEQEENRSYKTKIPQNISDAIPELDTMLRRYPNILAERSKLPGGRGWSYTFTVAGSANTFQVIDTKGGKPQLRQKIGDEWYERIDHFEGDGTIRELADSFGLWHCKEKDHYLIGLSSGLPWSERGDLLTFELNKKGRVERLKLGNEPCKEVPKKLVNDLRLPVAAGHVLQLENGDLYLLDQRLSLKKEGKGWTLEGNALIFEERKAQTAQERTLNRLRELLGLGTFLQAGSRLSVWPHHIGRDGVVFLSNLADAQKVPLLKIEVAKNGGIETTTAGYLYLAYRYITKERFEEAEHYLQRASETSMESADEIAAFNHMKALIYQSAKNSSGNIVVPYLKILYRLSEIERVQQGSVAFKIEKKKDYLAERKLLTNIYKKYSKGNIKVAQQLTEEETRYYEQVKRESLSDLLKEARSQTHALPSVKAAELSDPSFRSLLATYTTVSHEKVKVPLVPWDGVTLLAHFFNCLKAIDEGDITRKDIDFLFRPLPASGDLQLDRAADIARRLLIQKVHTFGSEEIAFDFEQYRTLKAQVPKELSTFNLFKDIASQLLTTGEYQLINPAAQEVIKLVQNSLEGLEPVVLEREKDYLSRWGFVLEQDLKKERSEYVDVNNALENIDEISKEIGFTDVEKMAFRTALTLCQDNGEEEISLELLLDAIEAGMAFSPIEMRREATLEEEIAELEKLPKVKTDPDFSHNGVARDQLPESVSNNVDDYFEPLDLARKTKLSETLPGQIKERFPIEGSDPTHQKEYEQIQLGADEAAARIESELNFQRMVKNESLEPLRYRIAVAQNPHVPDSAADRFNISKKELLNWANSDEAKEICPALGLMSEQPHLFTQDEMIDELLNLYQFGENRLPEKIVVEIERFLRYGTYLQQLKAASDKIAEIDRLPEGSPDLEVKSYELCEIITHRLRIDRYYEGVLAKENDVKRKVLVSEYRMGIILRDSQIKTILKIKEKPKSYQSLRMGEGKTFYIMPVIAALLIEKGLLPFMIVPKEQKSLNKASFDQTTRKVFGSRAQFFEIDIDRADSPAYLAECYRNLLLANRNNGYFVLTIDQLTTLSNVVIAAREERSQLFAMIEREAANNKMCVADFLANEKGMRLSFKLLRLEQRLHQLRRIELLLDSKRQAPEGVKAFFFADEIDALLHITKENNRSTGEKVPFDPIAVEAVNAIFTRLFTDEKYKGYAELLANRALKEEEAKKLLQLIAEDIARELGIRQSVAAYLTGERDRLPKTLDQHWLGTEKQQKVAAYKRLLSKTLPSILTTEPMLRYKFDEELGYLVVPAQLGRSEEGNRFGDEYEIIAAQYLGYFQAPICQAKNGSTQRFLAQAIHSFAFRNKALYDEIVAFHKDKKPGNKAATPLELAATLLEYPEEGVGLRLAILDQAVFKEGLMSRYREQISMPVQSVMSNRTVGGVTGTLNAYPLPGGIAMTEQGRSSRSVEAETFIKMGAQGDNGLLDPVVPFDEQKTLVAFAGAVGDERCVAIIDEGGYLTRGRTVNQSIEWLSDTFSEKVFLYPDRYEDPASGRVTTELFLKEPGKEARLTNKEELKRYKEPYITVFSPEFTRGTDLPILPGTTHYFPAKSTNLQDMGQSIWRGRGTGTRHHPIVHVPQSIYTDGMTVQDFLKYVTDQGLAEQLPLNLAGQRFKIKEISIAMVRRGLNLFSPQEGERSYWDPNTPENLYINARFEDALHQVFREYAIKGKKTDLESDYSPTKTVNNKEELCRLYDSEQEHLRRKQLQLAEAARDLFLKLAIEGGKEEETYANFEGLGSEDEIKLSVLLDGKEQKELFQLTMDQLREAQDPKEKDRIVAKAFFFILFKAAISAKPAKDNPYKGIDTAIDAIEDRMIDMFVDEFIKEKGEIKNREEFKELVRKNLNKSMAGEGSFSNLMIASTQDFSSWSIARNAKGLTMTQRAGVLATGFFTAVFNAVSTEKRERPVDIEAREAVSDDNKRDLEDFAEAVMKNRAVKDSWREKEVQPIIFGLNRFSDLYQRMGSVRLFLKKEKAAFEKEFDAVHSNYIPAEGKSSASGPSTQEQVQEQQQQQQQQQTMSSRKRKGEGNDLISATFMQWDPHMLLAPQNSFDFIKKEDGIYFSTAAEELYNVMPTQNGEPIWRLVINEKGDVCLLTKNDYYQMVERARNRPPFALGICILAPTQKGKGFIISGNRSLLGNKGVTERLKKMEEHLSFRG